jgi:rhodanese-related sulfurtransferase
MENKEIWIDIRDEHEVAENQIIAPTSTSTSTSTGNNDIIVMNIPSRNIFANVEWMEGITQKGVKIILICRSASRSKKVKDLYFSNNDNIMSLDNGIANPIIKLKSMNTKSNFGLGLQQILQIVFTTILIFILIISFYTKIEVVRYILAVIIIFILYQVISKSCLVGKYVPLNQIQKN